MHYNKLKDPFGNNKKKAWDNVFILFFTFDCSSSLTHDTFDTICLVSGLIGAHILDLGTIGFVTSSLTIEYNVQLASQTIGSMSPWKNENNYLY